MWIGRNIQFQTKHIMKYNKQNCLFWSTILFFEPKNLAPSIKCIQNINIQNDFFILFSIDSKQNRKRIISIYCGAQFAETNNFNQIQYERHLVNCSAWWCCFNYYLFVFEIIDSMYYLVRWIDNKIPLKSKWKIHWAISIRTGANQSNDTNNLK